MYKITVHTIICCLFATCYVYGQTQKDDTNIHNNLYYEYQIDHLNHSTPIPLQFHEDVKKYIDLYTEKRSEEFGKMLGLSDLYFPVFDEYLDKHQLPLELKYLSIVESSLNPVARSSSGALGLWQFKINAGRMFDLTINSYIDERLDVYTSTEAACKYFNYLYQTFNDWLLAISAYNGGPGVVRNAIERAGGNTNYWEIRQHMTDQAKNYVPAFIAAMYVMNYPSEHDITKIPSEHTFYNTDTLHVSYPVSFEQIADVTKLDIQELSMLNPIYKLNYIPGDGPYPLILPTDAIPEYLENETKIRAMKTHQHSYLDLVRKAHNTGNKIKITHKVQPGEFFHKIALQYNCTIENLKAWNDLDSNALHPGQLLDVWISPAEKNSELLNNE